jgi:hypothetical protein
MQCPEFWMVFVEGSESCRYRHFSEDAARNEAARLAWICPGKSVYVLKTVSCTVARLEHGC